MLYTDHGIGDSFEHVGRCFYGPDGKGAPTRRASCTCALPTSWFTS